MAPKGLTFRHYSWFVRAWFTLAECRLRLACQTFGAVRGWAARQGRGTARAKTLAWSVEAAAKRQRGATCLVKALALQRLLSRNGHQSELRIGVGKADGTFRAHAWLVSDRVTLIGGREEDDFKLLAAWPTSSERSADKGTRSP
ncbi:MAG: lasso peptide biosynthesis B2 protein [Rhodomicrobium sp.]